jgi:hypothetical protein
MVLLFWPGYLHRKGKEHGKIAPEHDKSLEKG